MSENKQSIEWVTTKFVNVYEIIIYHYWFGCFRLPAYIIRIFHTAMIIIELYILSVAMPMFGLCSSLGNTL